MRNRHPGAALLAVAALLCAPQAQAADASFPVRAGDGSTQNFAARIVGGLLYPIHILAGVFGSTPTPISVDSSGNVNVNCTSGCTGGGGGGSLSAKANAASQTSTEGATTDPLSMDLNRYLRVRAIQDGGAPWSVTFSSTPTINLGTIGSAATAANQSTALGYLASLVAATGSKAAGTAGASSLLTGGVYNSSAPSLTTGQQAATQLDSSGNTKVNCVTGCTGGGGGTTQPFAPDSYAPTIIAPTTSSTRSTVMGTGTTVDIINTGPVPVFVAVGGSSVTATTSSFVLYPGNERSFYYAAGSAYVAGITTSGTGQLTITSGTGSPSTAPNADLSQASPIKGTIASGSSASDAPVVEGCRAATTSPTVVTDGQVVYAQCGPGGKRVVEFAPGGLQVKGSGSATGTSATTIIAAQGAGVKIYVAQLECSNTSATAVTATLNDSAASLFIVPAGSGNNPPPFLIPLDVAANTALTFTSSASATTVTCNAQGFKGP